MARAQRKESWQRWPITAKRRYLRELWRQRYWDDPVAWIYDYIDWEPNERLAPYQEEALHTIHHPPYRLAQYGPHGLGKTTTKALAVWHFALTRDGEDWKAATTASVWRQLSEYLWPEIHKWGRRIRWDRLGRPSMMETGELLDMEIKGSTGHAFAVASNDPAKLEGVHADHVLYIYDEAKTIPADTFDATEGAFSGADPTRGRYAHALASSTPGDTSGRFYEICRRAEGFEDWKVRHIQLEEAVAAHRVNPGWARNRARQWGLSSAVYVNRVQGLFASTSTDSVIPLAWVEMANERWRFAQRALANDPTMLGHLSAVGCDVADEGEDKTVLVFRYSDVVGELVADTLEPGIRRHPMGDTMSTTGHLIAALRKGIYPDENNVARQAAHAVVDVIGVGAGVVARARELQNEVADRAQRAKIHAFNAGEGSDRTDLSGELEFLNLRAEAWWGMRERLDPANNPVLALPPDDELTGDLTAPKYRMTSTGKIQIESKDDIRKRIGRSTDVGDGVVMACWPPPVERKVRLIV